jgi:hypothetical protein
MPQHPKTDLIKVIPRCKLYSLINLFFISFQRWKPITSNSILLLLLGLCMKWRDNHPHANKKNQTKSESDQHIEEREI